LAACSKERRRQEAGLISDYLDELAAALTMSVISDGVLTALQLRGAEFHVNVLVPVISMAMEVAGVGVLAFQIWTMTRRAASMATLRKT
jgi:hypothetical protein